MPLKQIQGFKQSWRQKHQKTRNPSENIYTTQGQIQKEMRKDWLIEADKEGIENLSFTLGKLRSLEMKKKDSFIEQKPKEERKSLLIKKPPTQ